MGWTSLGHKPFVKCKHKVNRRDLVSTLNAAKLKKYSVSDSSSCSSKGEEEVELKTNLNPGSFTPRKVNESE